MFKKREKSAKHIKKTTKILKKPEKKKKLKTQEKPTNISKKR